MARPSNQYWEIPAAAGDPCPCGSGNSFGQCCDVPGELPLLVQSSSTPPPPVTGHQHPRCYMRATNDCSHKISSEHYVSDAILSEFGNLRTGGLPWFGPGETKVGKSALTSKILCTRHNSAFSPLDVAGWQALVAIRDCLIHAHKKSLSRKTLFRIISGDGLELWGLKTLMGFLAANVARTAGQSTAAHYSIDEPTILAALTNKGLPPGFGLYIGQDSDLLHDTIRFAPLTHTEDRRVAGLRVSFHGIVLDFLLDAGAAAHIIGTNDPHYRPVVLDLEGPERTGRVILTWAHQRRDFHRLAFEMRRVSSNGSEGQELQRRFANNEFERMGT